jgi:hypothetical protein
MPILFFALKPMVKKLLSIEFVIFHTFALSVASSKKYRSQEVALNKLEKGLFRDFETGFCSLLATMFLEMKIFKDLAIIGSFSLPVRKLFRIQEPYEKI